LNDTENEHINEELLDLLKEKALIFRIGSPKRSLSERLQLLIFKLIILLWEEDEEDIDKMEKKLTLIDDIRHELSFLRARYYKDIFNKKTGLKF
jgi:hypothetical protein